MKCQVLYLIIVKKGKIRGEGRIGTKFGQVPAKKNIQECGEIFP